MPDDPKYLVMASHQQHAGADGPSSQTVLLARQRPRARLPYVTTTLADFAIVTFAVEPEALARHLAPGFEPDVRMLASGRRAALVSAVSFQDMDFRFHFAPFLRFTFPQVNYRAYVLRNGEPCAWFFGTTLDTWWAWVPRYVWRLPWHRAATTLRATWDGGRCASYALDARGAWGEAEVQLDGTGIPMGTLDGFTDDVDTLATLTHPLDGFFRRRDGRVGTYGVWHPPLALERGRAARAHYGVFESLGLVDPGSAPHSVLIQRRTEFVILLPPRIAA